MKTPPSLSWVNKAPVLTEAEEQELVIRAKAGDRKAADRLMRSVAKSLLQLASKLHYRTGLELEDLFAAAMHGAYKAMQSYDATKGSLVAWAYLHARGEIRDIARGAFKRNRRVVTSIEAAIDEDADIPDEGAETPEEQMQRFEERIEARRAIFMEIQESSHVEKTVIHGRYFSEDEKTYAQLGKQVGRTFEAARMAEKRMLQRIKKRLR